MLTKEQLEERKHYIGASEAAACLGLSRWQTPLEVWAKKTGTIPDDQEENLATEVGEELEDLVCRLFSKRTGKKVQRAREIIRHPKYPFLACHLDRRVVGEDAILEAKTASAWKLRDWDNEEIPQEYLIQVHIQLAITGKAKGYIACLIGGNQKFVWKEVQRDEALVKELIGKLVYFWREFVEKKKMPAVTKNDAETLYSLFPAGDEGQEVGLGDEANAIIENLEALGKDCKNVIGQMDLARNQLKAMLGEAALGRTDKWVISWKTVVKKAHAVKESTYRELRYRKAKQEATV